VHIIGVFDSPSYLSSISVFKCRATVRGTVVGSAPGHNGTTKATIDQRRRRNPFAKLGCLIPLTCTFLYGCSSPSADANLVQQRREQTPTCSVYKIVGPTVIAFFEYESALKNPDIQDALDDFRFFLEGLREQIDESVIRIHECQRQSFELEVAGRRLRSEQSGAGYYLISPGKDARVERGVITDNDLIAVMREYFGVDVVDKALTRQK
jgi:hypothetical protein